MNCVTMKFTKINTSSRIIYFHNIKIAYGIMSLPLLLDMLFHTFVLL